MLITMTSYKSVNNVTYIMLKPCNADVCVWCVCVCVTFLVMPSLGYKAFIGMDLRVQPGAKITIGLKPKLYSGRAFGRKVGNRFPVSSPFSQQYFFWLAWNEQFVPKQQKSLEHPFWLILGRACPDLKN